jgi:hypothetical protein
MKPESLPSRAEVALWFLGKGEPVHVNAVTERLGLASTDRRRVRAALGDLVKGGRAEKMGGGSWRPLRREPGQPEKKQIMWDYLRARRRVSKEELMQAADASEHTVKDWLQAYIRLGLVVNEAGPGKEGLYRLIKDPVYMPADDLGEIQRRKRQRHKAALASLDGAFAAVARECPGKNGESLRQIAQARLAVCGMEE